MFYSEHFIIAESIRLVDYYRLHYRFAYIRTHDDVKINLVVERPGKPLLCIEIKSSNLVTEQDIKTFINLSKDIPNSEAICICDEEYTKKFQHVLVLPWRIALQNYFSMSQKAD